MSAVGIELSQVCMVEAAHGQIGGSVEDSADLRQSCPEVAAAAAIAAALSAPVGRFWKPTLVSGAGRRHIGILTQSLGHAVSPLISLRMLV